MKLDCRSIKNPLWQFDIYETCDGSILYPRCIIFVSPLGGLVHAWTYDAGEILHYRRYIDGVYVDYGCKIQSIAFIHDDYEGLLTDYYSMNLELPDGSVWRCTPWQRGIDPEPGYFSRMHFDTWVARERLRPAGK